MAKTITLKTKVRIGKDVVSRLVQNEEVILNLVTGTYFGLDEVGTFIWDKMKSEASLDEIFQELVEEYESEPARIKKDLLALAQKLQKCQLISAN